MCLNDASDRDGQHQILQTTRQLHSHSRWQNIRRCAATGVARSGTTREGRRTAGGWAVRTHTRMQASEKVRNTISFTWGGEVSKPNGNASSKGAELAEVNVDERGPG